MKCNVSPISYFIQREQNCPLYILSYLGHAVQCVHDRGWWWCIYQNILFCYQLAEHFVNSSDLLTTVALFCLLNYKNQEINSMGRDGSLSANAVQVVIYEMLRRKQTRLFLQQCLTVLCIVFLCQAKTEIDIKIEQLSSFGLLLPPTLVDDSFRTSHPVQQTQR